MARRSGHLARTNDITEFVEYTTPRFPRVRLRIFLNGTAPTARVKIYATGRDKA